MRNTTQAPAGLPVLGIGQRTISLSAALAEHLHWQRVRLDVIGGGPMLTIDQDGAGVSVSPSGRQGIISAPSVVNRIRDELGLGTKWVLERQGDSWIGRPLEVDDLTDGPQPGPSFKHLPMVAAELLRRMLRDGVVTVTPGYTTEFVLGKAQTASVIAWGDVRRGRSCERA